VVQLEPVNLPSWGFEYAALEKYIPHGIIQESCFKGSVCCMFFIKRRENQNYMNEQMAMKLFKP
jgi:hypothetical protein